MARGARISASGGAKLPRAARERLAALEKRNATMPNSTLKR